MSAGNFSHPPAPAAPARPAPSEIPSTWSVPAEVVSTVLPRAKNPSIAGPVIGVLVALSTAALVFLVLPWGRTAREATKAADAVPRTETAPVPPAPIEARAIPVPPSTSSTASTAASGVAPEDQGGELPATAGIPAPAKPGTDGVALLPTASETPPDTAAAPESPARKKAKALTARAIVLLRKGKPAAAAPALVRAVLTDPSHADAWRHLGIARAQLGELEGARRAYRKYLELAPVAPDAAQVRAILVQ